MNRLMNKFRRFIKRFNSEITWKNNLAVVLLIIAQILFYCIAILLPMLMSVLIDWVIPNYTVDKLVTWAVLSVSMYILYHFIDGFLIGYLNFSYEIILTEKMNMTLLDRTLKKPIYVFDKYSDGYMYSLIFQDTTHVVSVSFQMLIRFISITISLCITLLVLWNVAPFLFFVELIILPLVAITTVAFQPKLEALQTEQRKAWDIVSTNIQNILKSKKSVQLTKQEGFFVKLVGKYYKPYVKRNLKYWRAYFCATKIPELVVDIGNVVLLIGSALLYIKGDITLGVLVLSGTISARIVIQVQDILTSYLRRVANAVSFNRIDEFAVPTPPPEVFQHEEQGQSGIDLAHADVTVADQLLYTIGSFSSGTTGLIQIMGGNGSGKSTLFNLLTGVSDSEGLKIDEGGFLKIPPDFFKNCSYFSSPNILVNESVKTNILLGREETDRFSEVCQILKIDFLDKQVTTRPINLSFGEEQKLFLARALCGTEAIWLLDEPMTNLDSLTKESLTNYLVSQKKDHLIMVISHEDSLQHSCDKIYQIQNNLLVQVK